MAIPTLETERLLIRPFLLSDAPEVQRLAGEWIIADTCQLPHPYEDGEAEDWISGQESAYARHEEAVFAVELRTTGQLIGSVSLQSIFRGHQAELGYWIGREFWGHGYATECSKVLIEWGFAQFDLIRIHACHMSRNPSSGKVLHKIGMVHEGSCPKHFIKWGIAEDLELWGIVRDGEKVE